MTDRRPPNPLASTGIDRLGHRRAEPDWLERALLGDRVDYLPVQGSRNLIQLGDELRPAHIAASELEGLGVSHQQAILLGRRGDRLVFTIAVSEHAKPPPEHEFQGLRSVAHQLLQEDAGLLAYARAMVLWHEQHGFCSRCGSATRSVDSGHARICQQAACGIRHFPRVDPAIIVLVTRGDHCLLGRQPSWPEGRYSTIAGFVEPGESLEDAVRREVYEETGIHTTDPQYHSSQPWPFPSSLMLGYTAVATSEQIRLVDAELEEALWVSRDNMASGAVGLPTPMSIAYTLVRDWYNDEPGRDLELDTGKHQQRWR
ncbi:MAG: NAD(+) diphosphatase [Gammaproteobacteria bacterium]